MSTNNPSTSTTNTDNNDISPLDSKIQYERILVPHDGSEMSDRALRHAVYLSKISGAEIVILHVLERIDNILGKRKEELATTAEEDIRQGKPAGEIVSLVGEKYYDLIVMASSR